MYAKFVAHVDSLRPELEALLSMQPVKPTQLPAHMPKAGIYLLSEAGEYLYVGRSNDIRGRIGRHSRAGLMENPVFASAFAAAKARICEMELRFVEESDPVRQTLLEVYVAVVLAAKHNDFDNH